MNKLLAIGLGVAFSGAVFAAAPSHSVMPQNLGWYMGVGVNYTAATAVRLRASEAGASGIDYKQDHAQIGWNILVGNRLSRHFATEAGYNYIGNTRWKDRDNSEARIESINNYHIYYDGIFLMPLNPGAVHSFDVFARGGVGFYHVKNQFNTAASSSTSFSEALSTFALNYGAGLQYNFRKFTVRGTYSHVQPTRAYDDQFIIPDTINLDFIYHLG